MVNPTAMSGLRHLQHALGSVSHNLANVKTTAYRFQDVYSNEVRSSSRQGNYDAMGALSTATRYASKQGALTKSVSSSDLAINGEGYFMVEAKTIIEDTPTTETRYTRNGSFSIDKDGYFIDKNNMKLLFAKGVKATDNPTGFNVEPLQIDPELYKYIENININEQGEVILDYNTAGYDKFGKTSEHLGLVPLARFPREENAKRLGGGYVMPHTGSGDPINMLASADTATIRQGQLEQSTSDVTDQLTRMMVIQRGYQANSKALETQDKMLQNMIGNIR